MDEIWLAGMRTSGINNYLNNNSYWWLDSPRAFIYGDAFVWFANSVSGLLNNAVNYSSATPYGARPAISLKPGQNFEYGNGSGNNPYRFVATVPSS